MIKRFLRKTIIVLIILFPVFTGTDCKKQPKCGCNGDVLFSLTKEQANVYFDDDGSNIYFTLVSDPTYSMYYFCNSEEMFSKFADVKSGDIMLVTGDVFWECNFLYQSSNYSYYTSIQKVYQIRVKDVFSDLYGK